MFLKTLKHDLINSFKDYSTLYLTMILLAVFVPLALKSEVPILMSISVFTFSIILFLSFVMTAMNSINFLKRRLFEEGAYFNLTLPVSLDTTLMSKILTVGIWAIGTFLIFLFTLMIFGLTLGVTSIDEIQMILRQFIEAFRNIKLTDLILYILMIAVSIMTLIAQVLLSMTIVNTSFFRKNNYIFSILIFFGIGIVAGIINDMVVSAIFGSANLFSANASVVGITIPTNQMVANLIISAIWFGVYYMIIRYLFDRKLEI